MADFELSGLELLICPIVAPKYERDVHMAAPHPDRREPTFAELFTPKLVTLLREGYSRSDFRADALAGSTVAIVALPLSMAISIGYPESCMLPTS
jgi:hypothetical protein